MLGLRFLKTNAIYGIYTVHGLHFPNTKYCVRYYMHSAWAMLWKTNTIYGKCILGWFKKTQFWGNRLLFHFFNLYVEKKLEKAVACKMMFNTALKMTNLSLNSRNRLISCLGIGLLIGFLVFRLMKISFVKPEACAIIFNTASPVNKFMKQRN